MFTDTKVARARTHRTPGPEDNRTEELFQVNAGIGFNGLLLSSSRRCYVDDMQILIKLNLVPFCHPNKIYLYAIASKSHCMAALYGQKSTEESSIN